MLGMKAEGSYAISSKCMEFVALCVLVGGIWLIVRLISKSTAPSKGPQTLLSTEVSRLQPSPAARPPVRAAQPPQLPRQESAGRWIPPGQEIEIQGFRIPGGMLYVGRSMSRVAGMGVEPALINPSLSITSTSSDEMPYWPSYHDISPSARGAFLRWLAGDRKDPDAYIGLVFLFLYGLERRALAEKAHTTDAEWDRIRLEVRRLLAIYGGNSSFRNYATQFVSILEATKIDGDTLRDRVPVVTKSYESENLPLKIGLGWMANNGHTIPAAWAFAWVRSHDGFYERTPASRCSAEFERLFAIRYREKFGDGVVVKPNKTPITSSYRPASASFPGNVDISMPDLPNVTILKQPIDKLVALADQCTDELDSYSRFLGRNPGASDTPAGLALLPSVLAGPDGHPALAKIMTWAGNLDFKNDLAVADYVSLRGAWPSLAEKEISKREAVTVAQCLGKLGYGLEPDIRFAAHQLDPAELLVLFRMTKDAPAAPSAAYTSATLVAHLGALIAHADGEVAAEEEQALMSHAAGSSDLNAVERLRLRAYLKWLLIKPRELAGLKRRIESLSMDGKGALGGFLSRLVGLDGHIAPVEITALQKIYRQLGLNPEQVFADTHAAATEPIVVQASEPSPAYTLPSPKKGSAPIKPRVNLERIRAMEAESERVSVLLREIFVSEEEVVESRDSEVPHTVPAVQILDLDLAHSQFALALLDRSVWSRAELETIAAQHHLLPDGAVDAVNEASLNLHGDLLLEGDDSIEVNPNIRSAILP